MEGITLLSHDDMLDILGVPIGPDASVDKFLDEVVSKIANCVSRLPMLGSSHHAFFLLRSCLSTCKINHLLRCLPFKLGATLASKMKLLLEDALSEIIGLPLDPIACGLASFRIADGGTGLSDPTVVHAPAYLSSVFCSVANNPCMLPRSFYPVDFTESIASINQALCDAIPILSTWLDGVSVSGRVKANAVFDDAWLKQRWWFNLVLEQTISNWTSMAPLRAQRLRELHASSHAGLWLANTSAPDPVAICSSQWQVLFRFRLGLPLSTSAMPCNGCGNTMDISGDHALSCHKTGIYARHNALRDQMAAALGDLGLGVKTEVTVPQFLPTPDADRRPADIHVTGLDATPTAVDISIVHPLAPSNDLPAAEPGRAAKLAEAKKLSQSSSICSAAGWTFVPFVLETTGAAGAFATSFVKKLAKRKALRDEVNIEAARSSIWSALSATLARGVSRQLAAAFPSIRHLSNGVTP